MVAADKTGRYFLPYFLRVCMDYKPAKEKVSKS
jgi:hypothetical protein